MADESGFAAVEAWIKAIREMPSLGEEAMPEIAAKVGEVWRADLAAGRDPETGAQWAPTKDGEQPMKGAASAARLTVSGTTITLSVGNPYVFHHYGVRGAEPRHVVPTGSGVPMKLGNAVRLGIIPVWHNRTRGR